MNEEAKNHYENSLDGQGAKAPQDQPPKFLKHYTRLPLLLSILESDMLMLSKTESWNDLNDAAAVNAYARKVGAQETRVLCLASDIDTVHNWFYYAKGEGGCCIMFDEEKFFARIESFGFLHGPVRYVPSRDLSAAELRKLTPEQIPFIKRRPYECEGEYRLVWAGNPEDPAQGIAVRDCIRYVTLGPEFKESAAVAIGNLLKDKYGIPTNRSRILKNKDWISKFDNL